MLSKEEKSVFAILKFGFRNVEIISETKTEIEIKYNHFIKKSKLVCEPKFTAKFSISKRDCIYYFVRSRHNTKLN